MSGVKGSREKQPMQRELISRLRSLYEECLDAKAKDFPELMKEYQHIGKKYLGHTPRKSKNLKELCARIKKDISSGASKSPETWGRGSSKRGSPKRTSGKRSPPRINYEKMKFTPPSESFGVNSLDRDSLGTGSLGEGLAESDSDSSEGPLAGPPPRPAQGYRGRPGYEKAKPKLSVKSQKIVDSIREYMKKKTAETGSLAGDSLEAPSRFQKPFARSMGGSSLGGASLGGSSSLGLGSSSLDPGESYLARRRRFLERRRRLEEE